MGKPERGDNLETILKTIKFGGFLLVMYDVETSVLIGTSWLTNDGRRLYLHHFGIDPAYQGKGYSKPLVEESLKIAKQKKMQIKLEVHRNNKNAIGLYKKYGFGYLGDYDVYIIREINA